MIEQKFIERIAMEARVRPQQVAAAIPLFDKGATVPFVARYRKDVTGNLDEVQLETVQERNVYYTALSNRRDAILQNIEGQEKLTDELKARINACTNQTSLEDLYLPYKKQRRTKASIAMDQGLEPLADFIWAQEISDKPVQDYAEEFVKSDKGVSSAEEALTGAYNILAERVAMDADARALLRTRFLEEGMLKSVHAKSAPDEKTKFEAYYEYSELLKQAPSHRLLAVLRGTRMGILRMDLLIDDTQLAEQLKGMFIKDGASPYAAHLGPVIEDAYNRLPRPSIENEVVTLSREKADDDAIFVFRENAENLLLAPPAGRIAVLGVDPGMRTGCKLAVVNDTGDFLESATIFLVEPQKDEAAAETTVITLMDKFNINAIAIGNGTGSREVARFINGVLRKHEKKDAFTVLVNESGASVYSASKLARDEFPDLDIIIRGAISIARRLQDPLAELVKIEPRSVGVGQYQHDVNQRKLREGLKRTVEISVNRVGVDLNTASVELLRYVSGIQQNTAENIVAFRTEHGGIKTREQLKEISGIGEKTYEQSAGFLRVQGGDVPLDATSIHPEAYPVVEQIATSLEKPIAEIIADPKVIKDADLSQFSTDVVGRLTLEDIRAELMKPGRDPRREFKVPEFLEGVNDVKDLEEGMVSEGVVTNITDFGAFVDIGVHQDGLIHLSELANKFVRDPREVVKVGDIVKVKVIKIDKEMNRISLSRKVLLETPKPRRPIQKNVPHQGEEPRDAAQRDDRRPARKPERKGRNDRDKPRGPRKPRRDDKPKQPSNTPLTDTLLADQPANLRDKFNK